MILAHKTRGQMVKIYQCFPNCIKWINQEFQNSFWLGAVSTPVSEEFKELNQMDILTLKRNEKETRYYNNQ